LTFLRVLGFPQSMSQTGVDRRTRRRQATIEEILEVAIELMETEGVAALSLSAVARRLGMQPPSLYQYFPSKMAIYDALFQRGAELVLAVQREAVAAASEDEDRLQRGIDAFCRWCLQHPVYSQLLFWRTVPGFEPSPEAFEPAKEAIEELRKLLQDAVDAGRLHPDAADDEAIALFTSMTAGVLSQQIANQPNASFEDGRFSRLLPVVLEMFYQRYAPIRG
jgi:AcrR family transcriptional regulator